LPFWARALLFLDFLPFLPDVTAAGPIGEGKYFLITVIGQKQPEVPGVVGKVHAEGIKILQALLK
jgi:hypothetical protein